MAKRMAFGWKTSLAFIAGAVASSIAGFLGMYIATRSNARTAAAAESGGTPGALDIAISGGAVMGMGVVGVALLGLVMVYYAAGGDALVVNGYAMGASLVFGIAYLIPRVGAGPFTYALLAGQIVSAMVLSHYGWLGSPRQPVTPMGVVGVIVLVVGVILTRR